MTREEALRKYYREEHRDYKGTIDGVKTVMVYRQGTRLIALDDLTDAELAGRVKEYQPT